ncbi:hypothetical protein AC1031_020471 [Aphanomyces cochlioides]|nr:hypothetical protein AC1031_020471 [Aphanomyces cochlioides]
MVAAAPPASDIFVLSQLWLPYFCTTGRFPGCQIPTNFMASNLTIQGLWPATNAGTYPSFCGGSPLTQGNVNQAGADKIAQYWPDVVSGGWNLAASQWKEHGTCNGLDAVSYPKATLASEISIGTFSPTTKNIGSTVSLRDLNAAHGIGKKALICYGSENALAESARVGTKRPSLELTVQMALITKEHAMKANMLASMHFRVHSPRKLFILPS